MNTVHNKWPCSWPMYFFYWCKSVLRMFTKRPKKMKLAAVYNLFDGEEILPYSLHNIRPHVDKIIVVYQLVSNMGQPADPSLESLLKQLQQQGFIDFLYCYTPNLKLDPMKNELAKRRLGRRLAMALGCSHFLHMDTDEFFAGKEFEEAKTYIQQRGIKFSAVSIIEYLKSPCYEIVNGYTVNFGHGDRYVFYAPFITSIQPFRRRALPIIADPTRQFNGYGRFWLFPKHSIVLHHYSTLRKNLNKKYDNSSLHVNADCAEEAKKGKRDIPSWKFEEHALSSEFSMFNDLIIKKVPNLFNLPEEL